MRVMFLRPSFESYRIGNVSLIDLSYLKPSSAIFSAVPFLSFDALE